MKIDAEYLYLDRATISLGGIDRQDINLFHKRLVGLYFIPGRTFQEATGPDSGINIHAREYMIFPMNGRNLTIGQPNSGAFIFPVNNNGLANPIMEYFYYPLDYILPGPPYQITVKRQARIGSNNIVGLNIFFLTTDTMQDPARTMADQTERIYTLLANLNLFKYDMLRGVTK